MPTVEGMGSGFYVRQATGLVREIGTTSNIALNVSFISLPLAVLVATQAPYAFPGANIILVVLITVVLCVLPTLMYGWLATVMPRSGGDYVFVSRIFHPIIGFAANFNVTMWFLLFAAQFGSLVAPFGLSAALATIGEATGNQGLIDASSTVAGQAWQFWGGVIAIVVSIILMSFNIRMWTRIFVFLFGLSLVGVVIAVILTAANGPGNFESALRRFGTSTAQVVQAAREAGYQGATPFSFTNTLWATPLAFASFGYAIVTTYAGGEIRAPRRTLLKALLASLAIAGGITLILMLLATRTFGHDFLGAVTFLSNDAPDQYPFSAPAFYFLFVAMLTDNTFVIGVMAIAFVIAFVVIFPPTFLIASRNLFAWSFDRILPTRIAAVNERTHSPLIANAIVLAISVIFLGLIVYGPSEFLTLAFTAVAGELLTFLVVAIAATAFPWRRRELWAGSPADRRILGLPAISVVGFLSIGVYLLFIIPLLVNDALGANATPGIVAMIVIALLPFVIYGISYAVNRGRGVDLGAAFQQLPPE